MPDPVYLTIKGNPPSKSNSYKIISLPNGKGGRFSSLGKQKGLKVYEKAFAAQVMPRHRVGIETPVSVSMNVFFDSRRPDLDNALKIILDCLQSAGVIKNDRLVHELYARKGLDKTNPRVEITVTELQQ